MRGVVIQKPKGSWKSSTLPSCKKAFIPHRSGKREHKFCSSGVQTEIFRFAKKDGGGFSGDFESGIK
jgi:hypothetical protein